MTLQSDARRMRARAIPPRAGVSLKSEHYRTIVETVPDIGFFEVHAENYMGGAALRTAT